MQLDRTEIAIHQRNLLELLDLSLLLLRRHFKPLAYTSLFLLVPLMLIDLWVCSWMVNEDSVIIMNDEDMPSNATTLRFLCHFVVLVSLQVPLATLPCTIFLGKRTFFQESTLSAVWKDLKSVLPASLWVLGILRAGLVVLALEFLVDRESVFSAIEGWSLAILIPASMLIRACWPFAPEIIGLERCKLRSNSTTEITVARRSKTIHGMLTGDHFIRFLSSLFFGAMLLYSLVGTSWLIQSLITADWVWGSVMTFACFPFCMWVLCLYFVCVRFLAYLDSRIRLEGWELELRLRAEAERLLEQERPHVPVATNPESKTDEDEVEESETLTIGSIAGREEGGLS